MPMMAAPTLDHAMRLSGIGASEISAVCGISPFDTPLGVYLRKTGQGRKADSERMRWGRLLESVIAARYEDETGALLRGDGTITVRHPEHSWMLATPDRFYADMSRLVEIKNVAADRARSFGESGTCDVPDVYIAQVCWQQAVTGIHSAHLVALIGGSDLRVYDVPWNETLAGELIERGRAFWYGHVIAGVPPEPSDPAEWDDYLSARYPADSGETIEADESLEYEVARLVEARAAIAEAEAVKADAERAIKSALGEASVLRSRAGTVTWKAARPSRVTDWKECALAVADPETIAAHTTTKAGSRRFLVKETKE
jgi:putative phage-type endonuclease